jgi:hypothetical protein
VAFVLEREIKVISVTKQENAQALELWAVASCGPDYYQISEEPEDIYLLRYDAVWSFETQQGSQLDNHWTT